MKDWKKVIKWNSWNYLTELFKDIEVDFVSKWLKEENCEIIIEYRYSPVDCWGGYYLFIDGVNVFSFRNEPPKPKEIIDLIMLENTERKKNLLMREENEYKEYLSLRKKYEKVRKFFND